ncbi:MAG: Dam family site-specific DNA-(adenine-N6)-methyltransferase [Bacilli bacterium]|nr:Dam family site-specific DNA-(adenine-N6)-methyltransferase [Bacilli bacterium]
MSCLNKIIGENIKQSRIESGYTQAKLSTISNVERSQISRIEKGEVSPRAETIEAIAKALGVEAFELLNAKEIDKLRPFVKWAGGKTQLLKIIMNNLPSNYNNYFEPFVGGGALFLKLHPKKAFINDLNKDLLCVYRCLNSQSNYKALKEYLDIHEENHSESYYLKIRDMDKDPSYSHSGVFVKAARLIYLNKACFNGIYRVNSSGYFNVPSAKKEKVVCYNRQGLDGIRKYFRDSDIKITNYDFEKAVAEAQKGDFVYFDPPYDDWEDKPTFRGYTAKTFSKKDQVRLAECCKRLNQKGVFFMLSNNNTAFIRDLYNEFNIKIVPARRMINSNPNGRGKVEEVLITNY